ncbi:hypothetical protein GYMLUDRAFT_62257 [Collybiopsis luxurians FD-317 M1]|uniref:Uncharacterized protein n=1 Tax=Collybiopsis luxurians FD-317 M1 TaxID=944289 RepID=A0A0D0BM87_9AGAR|nr:hypothetical protein GYMLUDRAFT_62257 [Collybiopsis luxurians FD-317 M1]
MQFCGYSQLEKGSVDKLLAGQNSPAPSGYETYAVLYKLQGGTEAQKYYYSHQTNQITEKLQLQLLDGTISLYQNPEYREMDKDETVLEYTLKTEKISSDIDSALVAQELTTNDKQRLETKQLPVPNGKPKTTHDGEPVENNSVLNNIDQNMDSENQLDLEIQTSMSSSPAPSDPAHSQMDTGKLLPRKLFVVMNVGDIHIAPRISGQFLCHICNPKITDFTNYIPPARKSLRCPHSMKTAHEHLFPGKGALVKLHVQDKYFYPAHILATDAANGTSTVHMW